MDNEIISNPQSFFPRWILASLFGWILGVLIIMVLAQFLDSSHIGGQFPVGVGMGLAVGYTQWRVGRKWFGATSQWLWATLVGMGASFVLFDIVDALWKGAPFMIGSGYLGLFLCVALGSLIVGIWQRRILESHSTRATWWIAGCIASWILATLTVVLIMVPGRPESSLALWRNFGAIPLGGAVFGVLTGGALVWLLRPLRSETTAAPPTNA